MLCVLLYNLGTRGTLTQEYMQKNTLELHFSTPGRSGDFFFVPNYKSFHNIHEINALIKNCHDMTKSKEIQ